MTAPEASVSVVIPTRDRLPLLVQTLHTVLSQNLDIEVIVVDEASSDGTAEWLAALGDPRVGTVRHDRAQGLPAARNAGLAAAAGRWVAFVDDDDLWAPDKLAAQLTAADEEGAPWAYAGSVDVTGEPAPLRVTIPQPDAWQRLPWLNVVPGGGSNAVVERAALAAVGGFDTTLPTAEDWDMWIRLGQLARPAVVERPLTAYRVHPGNMSKSIDGMLRGIGELDRRYRHLRGGEALDWDDTYRWLGREALRSGDRRAAVELAARGLRRGHPGSLRRMARALTPVRSRAPVTTRGPATSLLDRVRPRSVVPWPPDTEDWVRAAMRVTVT
jgi:glycosyltransferase involved in cell wall biosynthesis